MTISERFREWRNALLGSERFQRRMAMIPGLRALARREAAAMFDVVAGFVYSQVLLACVRLDLFARLRGGSRGESELLRELRASEAGQGISEEALRTLLRAAESLDLIERRTGETWGLARRGAALLGLPGVLAMIEHHAVLYRDLADPLAMLRSARGDTALARYWPYARSPVPGEISDIASRDYTQLMSSSQGLVSGEILDAYDVSRHRSILDVGGGNGRFLLAVSQRAPSAALCVFDLPPIAAQAQANFQARGLGAQARAVGGDFTRDPLPTGADLLCFVRVLHDHDDPRVERLLQAAFAALPPGGTVLIAEPLAGTPGAERMGAAYFGFYLWAMGSGRPRTRAELTDRLRRTGFVAIREHLTRVPLQTRVLTAKRPR